MLRANQLRNAPGEIWQTIFSSDAFDESISNMSLRLPVHQKCHHAGGLFDVLTSATTAV